MENHRHIKYTESTEDRQTIAVNPESTSQQEGTSQSQATKCQQPNRSEGKGDHRKRSRTSNQQVSHCRTTDSH